jgi:hypothetical protein
MAATLAEVQRIPTSGARAVEAFTVDDVDLLAIAQVALDMTGGEASMNGGDSTTELQLLRRSDGRFEPWATLVAPGGEDAEFFTIGTRSFLAVASIRTGSGPYDYETESRVFEWDGSGFVEFQRIPTFAAKQWKHWHIGNRNFLGLAQGVQLPGLEDSNRDSIVYEWDGSSFVEYQRVASRWAYNWHAFGVDDTHFVAHAEHLGASVLYRWDGDRLQPHQSLMPSGGRAFATFGDGGESYLVAAAISAPPRLMRWNGEEFEDVQVLDGLGARELAVVRRDGRVFLVRINFILGTPADPDPMLESQIYEWDGGALRVVARFPTSGGTDVAVIGEEQGEEQGVGLVVSNSLTQQLRFATDSVVYSFRPGDR